MNSLQKSNNEIQTVFHGYTFKEKEARMITARKSKDKISILKDFQVVQYIKAALDKATLNLNHKAMTDEQLSFTANAVYKHLRLRYATTTVEELILCIELGSFGEFGEDVVFISAQNVIKWLKAYQQEQVNVFITLGKAKEKEALRDSLNTSKEKELDYWNRFPRMVENEYQFFKDNKKLSEAGGRIVTGLWKIGYREFMSVDNDLSGEIYEEERKKVVASEVDRKQKTMIAFSPKAIKYENIEGQVGDKWRQRLLMLWFDGLKSINTGEIESLTKKIELWIS